MDKDKNKNKSKPSNPKPSNPKPNNTSPGNKPSPTSSPTVKKITTSSNSIMKTSLSPILIDRPLRTWPRWFLEIYKWKRISLLRHWLLSSSIMMTKRFFSSFHLSTCTKKSRMRPNPKTVSSSQTSPAIFATKSPVSAPNFWSRSRKFPVKKLNLTLSKWEALTCNLPSLYLRSKSKSHKFQSKSKKKTKKSTHQNPCPSSSSPHPHLSSWL